MRVLVVEDQRWLAEAVAEGLRREGIAVDLSYDGADALTHVAVNSYEVVVLARDLPLSTATRCAARSWPSASGPGCHQVIYSDEVERPFEPFHRGGGDRTGRTATTGSGSRLPVRSSARTTAR